MWTDPVSVEYAFFGLDWLSLAAGSLVAVILAVSSLTFHHRRGKRGRAWFYLSLSTFVPLVVSAFLVRTIVAFILIAVRWTFESASTFVLLTPGADVAVLIFSIVVLLLLTGTVSLPGGHAGNDRG